MVPRVCWALVCFAACVTVGCAADEGGGDHWETLPASDVTTTAVSADQTTEATAPGTSSSVGDADSVESGESGPGPKTDLPPPATPHEALCRFLDLELPPPTFDPTSVVDWWEEFTYDHPNRSHGTSNNLAAASFLEAELAAAGYQAQTLEYSSSIGTVRVVEGIHLGSENPDRYVALGAHYDSITGTIYGAYDNAAGVAVQMTLCKLFAQLDHDKSVACLFFDAEENGKVASARYVDQVVETGSRDVEQMFGYDMVGLNSPALSWKLYASLGLETSALSPFADSHISFIDTALFDCLADKLSLSTEAHELIPFYDKRSDEENFMFADVPILRYAGGRNASDYNGYHNSNDTVENVYSLTGGRANFELGMKAAIDISYYTIMAFDRYDPLALPEL